MNEIREANIKEAKAKKEIFRNAFLKECFLHDHVDECSEKIINAHSLQRMGALNRLESEIQGNKLIIANTDRRYNEDTGEVEFDPIGKKVASTFTGFCKDHDSHLFKPVEENTESIDISSDKHCFLLSFRGFALSYHRKKEYLNLLSTNDEDLIQKIKAHFNNDDLQPQIQGVKVGLNDMEPNRKVLVETLFSEDYSSFEFFTYEVEHAVPFAMTMATSPAFLFNGKRMNQSEDPNYQYSDILTTVIPLESRSIIILTAFKKDPLGSKFLDELDQMPHLILEKALTFHILTNSENIFFSPKWFYRLNSTLQRWIMEITAFSANLNTPYLKFDKKKILLNLFDRKHKI